MALTTRIILNVLAQLSGTIDLSDLRDRLDYTKQIDLANGSGAGQANAVWHDQRTLGVSSSEDLDLSGVLTDAFGATKTFTKIKAIIVYAASGNGDNIQVGGAATNAFVNWVASATDIVNVPPGGLFVLIAPDVNGFGVTAGTADLLKVANADSGAGATYDIVIVGVE